MKIAKRAVFNPFSQLKDADKYSREADRDLQDMATAMSGRIRFGDGTASGDRGENMSGNFYEFTTDATPGVTNTVTHGWGEESKGHLILEQDKAGTLITSSKTDTTTVFSSDVASVTFRIFLLK